MDDNAGAIRILKEQSHKPETKFESAQTDRINTPSVSEQSSARSKNSFQLTLEPNTHVYAVWFDDDGLVYEVNQSYSYRSIIYHLDAVILGYCSESHQFE